MYSKFVKVVLFTVPDPSIVGLREVFKKLRREKLYPKNTRGGGGGQRCQKDTTVPTKSDFNAISTKNSRISTILWQKRTQWGGGGGGPRVLYFLDAIFPVLVF